MTAAFLVFGFVAVLAAVMVVASRNPVVAALWLALALASTAGLFVVLGAEFLGAIQIILYAGAVMVFFLFVVMSINMELPKKQAEHPYQNMLAVFGPMAFVLILLFVFRLAALPETSLLDTTIDNSSALAAELFSRYLAPFEFASVLLLIAMVGAVVSL